MDHTLADRRPENCSREPTMKLPRPSSPRNQDVSSVLSEVFSDLHYGHVLDNDTIDNLYISRTNGDDFHDYYVDLLKQIKNERDERLGDLINVEKHMMSAYSLAASQTSTLNSDTLQGFDHYLDTDLMEQFNLLTPGSYLPVAPPALKEPAPPTLPNYMRGTKVAAEKEKAKLLKPLPPRSGKPKKHGATTGAREIRFPAKAAWTKTLTPDKRDIEMKKLEMLQATSKFLKAKRFDATEDSVFIAIPDVVEFLDYVPGEVYEQRVKIKNVSTVSKQMQLLPPSTKFFTYTKVADPGTNGNVAPGLAVEYKITFMPNSLGLFNDTIQVTPQGGTPMFIPLVGCRTPPSLTLPRELDVGHCLVYGTLKTSFVCKNVGGEGRFYLFPEGKLETPFLFDDLVPPPPELSNGHFNISPTSFSLSHNEEININIEFYPKVEDDFKTNILIAASDCTVKEIKLTAMSEWCKVQLLAISGGVDNVDYDIRYEDDPNKEILVKFPDQNPGTVEQKLIIIRNCVKVPLHYNWEMCKEISENDEEKKEILLKEDAHSPFSIEPDNGILNPNAEVTFTVSCAPKNIGVYNNVSRFMINHVPSETLCGEVTYGSIEGTRFSLTHTTKPYQLSLVPPVLMIPGVSVARNTVTKSVKIVNDSIANVAVTWRFERCRSLKVNMRPHELVVEAGLSRAVEVDIVSNKVGDIEDTVYLHVSHVDKPMPFFIKGSFRGPKVTIYTDNINPVLDFGYIRFVQGITVQRQFDIINHDCVSASWSIAEIPSCINTEYGGSEFEFSLASGVLEPFEVKQLHVSFSPKYPRSVQTYLECNVKNGSGNKIRVVGEVQEPKLALKNSVLDLGLVYLNTPVRGKIEIESLNFVDCIYNIRSPEGSDKTFGTIEFDGDCGKIYAGMSTTVEFTFSGTEITTIQDYIVAIDIEDSEERLAFQITARVAGLTVIHETPQPDQMVPETRAEKYEKPVLDFGDVEILTPNKRVLKIINNTAIPTQFNLEIVNFNGVQVDTPAPLSTDEQPMKTGTALLSRTPYLPTTKTTPHYWENQLKTDKGVCFVASPMSGFLPAHGVTIVTVQANSDMWGRYEDVLISRVGELDPVHIPIKMNVQGSPINFKLSNSLTPIIRFGNYPLNEPEIPRTLHITNKGPQDIRLDWVTYNRIPEDKCLIDLDFFVGDAFPLATSGPSPAPDKDLIRVKIREHNGEKSDGPFRFDPVQCVIPARNTSKIKLWFNPGYVGHKTGGVFDSYAMAYQSLDKNINTESCQRDSAEDVDPLVINMTGKIQIPEVTVTTEAHGFNFKLVAGIINSVNEHVKIHRMSLLNESKLNLVYDIRTEKPFLLCPAPGKTMLKPRIKQKVEHGFQLSEDLLSCLVGVKKQHFYLAHNGKEYQEVDEGKIEVSVEENMLIRTHEQKDKRSGEISTHDVEVPELRFYIHGNIDIVYNNGHVQNIPVTSRIVFPTLYILPSSIDFGECFVGQEMTKAIRLINPTNAPVTWTIEQEQHFNPDNGTFTLSPTSGQFPVTSDVIITVTFVARDVDETRAEFLFVARPGNRRLPFAVVGTGSHDEKMKRLI